MYTFLNQTLHITLVLLTLLCPLLAESSEPNKDPKKTPIQNNLPVPHLPDNPAPSQEALDTSINRGIQFLLNTQNKDGSWGDHGLTKGINILCPPPGGPLAFKVGSTGLCIIGLTSAAPDNIEVQKALDKSMDWLLAQLPKVKRSSPDTLYNIWAHAYGIRALCALSQRYSPESESYKTLKKECEQQMKRIYNMTFVSGGWGYLEQHQHNHPSQGNATSFTTATALIALKEAEQTFNITPDEKINQRCAKYLFKQRTPSGAYVYSTNHMLVPARDINRRTGSLARTPTCNLALRLHGYTQFNDEVLTDGLECLWARGGWLSNARKKPIPHECFAQNSGYFFYYGYFYAMDNILQLPKDKQDRHSSFLTHVLLPLQEKDGSWWDYPLYNYHKPYGTGYALYSLSKARQTLYNTEKS